MPVDPRQARIVEEAYYRTYSLGSPVEPAQFAQPPEAAVNLYSEVCTLWRGSLMNSDPPQTSQMLAATTVAPSTHVNRGLDQRKSGKTRSLEQFYGYAQANGQ